MGCPAKAALFIGPDYAVYYLQITALFCNFVMLIEKDGGTGPCEVLATCAYKVLHST